MDWIGLDPRDQGLAWIRSAETYPCPTLILLMFN